MINPYKNISVLRDKVDMDISHLQQENDRLHQLTNVLIQHIWKIGDRGLPLKEIDRQMELYDKENMEMTQLQQENDRLQHLTTVLIDHIWKTGDRGLPLKEIDKQMKIFDDGGMDGIQRNK